MAAGAPRCPARHAGKSSNSWPDEAGGRILNYGEQLQQLREHARTASKSIVFLQGFREASAKSIAAYMAYAFGKLGVRATLEDSVLAISFAPYADFEGFRSMAATLTLAMTLTVAVAERRQQQA
jgi:hypothetical protein